MSISEKQQMDDLLRLYLCKPKYDFLHKTIEHYSDTQIDHCSVNTSHLNSFYSVLVANRNKPS